MKKTLSLLISVMMVLGIFSIARPASAGSYTYELITQSVYPATLQPGETTNVWIEVKNTGTATWYSDGDNPVRLGAGSKYGTINQQRDYSSEFANTDWLSPNRPTAILHSEVRPGWHTRFQFNIKAPSTAGTYKAYFTPVVDGFAWLADIGIYWQLTVTGDVVDNSNNGNNNSGDGNTPANDESSDGAVCATVITYARNPDTGTIEAFPTSCVTEGWEVVSGPAPSEQNVTAISVYPASASNIQSGKISYFTAMASYTDGSTADITDYATWSVEYDTGTGVVNPPGRFIAGSIGTCRAVVNFAGLTAKSGVITITSL